MGAAAISWARDRRRPDSGVHVQMVGLRRRIKRSAARGPCDVGGVHAVPWQEHRVRDGGRAVQRDCDQAARSAGGRSSTTQLWCVGVPMGPIAIDCKEIEGDSVGGVNFRLGTLVWKRHKKKKLY